MAEQETFQERTEEPTPKRLREALVRWAREFDLDEPWVMVAAMDAVGVDALALRPVAG